MDVTIRGENIKVTDALEDFAQKKLGKLDRYLPNITEVHLDLTRNHTKRGENITIAQITLRHARGAILRAEERIQGDGESSIQPAITAAVDKMYRQIDRFKGKRRDNKRRKGRYYATPEELSTAEEVPNYEEIAAEYENFEEVDIVRRKEVDIQAMDEEEAIAQMELLGHAFFMFMNAKSGEINVLYRRDSGGYGVLVPEKS
jgi:putative sigma-54 modulation protein